MIRIITEFANNKKEEIQKLKNIREVLREHMMAIYYWRGSSCKNHWEGEIVGFLPVMSKLKTSHKLLSEPLIFENLFTDWADRFVYDIGTYVDKLNQKEPNLPEIRNMDTNRLYKFLEEFYTLICHILATEGSVRKHTLYTIIEKLLQKYPYKMS